MLLKYSGIWGKINSKLGVIVTADVRREGNVMDGNRGGCFMYRKYF